MKEKTIIGLTENIVLVGPKKNKKVLARIDTGATVGSVDEKLAKELELGPIVKTKIVKSAHGIKKRPVIRTGLRIKDRKFKNVRFTLADRSHLKYKILIGQNILKKDFLIDPSNK